MIRLLIIVLALAAGCVHKTEGQAILAHQVGIAGNAAIAMLADEQVEQSRRAAQGQDSRDAAEDAVDRVRARWEPVWAVADIFRASHDLWIEAIKTSAPDIQARMTILIGAFCDLVATGRRVGVELEILEGLRCE